MKIKEIQRATQYAPMVVSMRHHKDKLATEAYEAGVDAVAPTHAVMAVINKVSGVRLGRPLPETIVWEFHDPKTGRIDARRAAQALGISLAVLAKASGLSPSALSRRPNARAAQASLRELEFAWATLRRMLGSSDLARAWLNAGHPDLDGEPPITLLREGSAKALADYLRRALAGQPT
ncbi:MAG: antitoxin Xre/MbcA/ParS toxin-binding domain-containing protein [Candidatus Methylomirabilales bacterium]